MLIRLLAVDDDDEILEVIRCTYRGDKTFRVDAVNNAETALESLAREKPDLIILDYHLPRRNGGEFCRLLKKDPRNADIGILMLTGRDKVQDKVRALEDGVDDYLTKPFQVPELKARVTAILRRRTPWLTQSQVMEIGEIKIDPGNYQVFVGQREIALTKAEFEILYLLAANAGRLISRDFIANRVLDAASASETRLLNTHISHLREKLGKAGRRIETQKGLGYTLLAD